MLESLFTHGRPMDGFFYGMKLNNGYVDQKMTTSAVNDIMASCKWVKFLFLVNYPFNQPSNKLCLGPAFFLIQSLILLLLNFALLSKISVQESASHMLPHWFQLVAIRTRNLCDNTNYLITFFTFKFFAVSRHGSCHFGLS